LEGDNLNFEELAQIATGVLAAAGVVYKYTTSKYGREILSVNDDKTIALEALNEIKTLYEDGKAASADGNITAEEMEKIYNEAMNIISSPAVEKLIISLGE
jgi:hypothetical protein